MEKVNNSGMNTQQKRRILYILIVIITTAILFAIQYWGYLPFQGKDYDRAFNKERKELNQPIIEDFFIAKFPSKSKRQVWYVVDSLKKNYIHTGKNYWTENGKINLEIDYYRYYFSSNDYQKLIREYDYLTSNVKYSIKTFSDENIIEDQQLSIIEGDSILNSWLQNK